MFLTPVVRQVQSAHENEDRKQGNASRDRVPSEHNLDKSQVTDRCLVKFGISGAMALSFAASENCR